MTVIGAMLTVISGGAAMAAAGTGLWAARLWFRASKAAVNPIWGPSGWEPVDPQQAESGWITGLLVAGQQGADLNARAARWTAAAVVFAAVQSLAGFLASALA